MGYGTNRDHPKIDIYVEGNYVCSTTWASSCKEAVAKYREAYPDTGLSKVQAKYADK